jgi:hypothetical protein
LWRFRSAVSRALPTFYDIGSRVVIVVHLHRLSPTWQDAILFVVSKFDVRAHDFCQQLRKTPTQLHSQTCCLCFWDWLHLANSLGRCITINGVFPFPSWDALVTYSCDFFAKVLTQWPKQCKIRHGNHASHQEGESVKKEPTTLLGAQTNAKLD